MKKIVALVLCLVLALALCTTAMAADTKFAIYAGDNTECVDDMYALYFKKVAAKAPVYDAKTGAISNGQYGNVAYVEFYGTTGIVYAYGIECAQADAKFVVKTDDAAKTTTLYLSNLYVVANPQVDVTPAEKAYVQYSWTAPAFTNIGTKCGQLNVATTGTYITYQTDAVAPTYATLAATPDSTATVANNVLYNGKIVDGSTTTTAFVGHTWVGADKNAAGTKFTTAKCSDCGIVGTIYAAKINAPKGLLTVETFINGSAEVIAYSATAAGTTTVESAKTFDAGIALYAGMALASVAGSAVVIGKKKEF